MINYSLNLSDLSTQKNTVNAMKSIFIGDESLHQMELEDLSQISQPQKRELALSVMSKKRSSRNLLFLFLVEKSNGGRITISRDAIARYTNTSISTISRWITELVDLGLLRVKRHKIVHDMNGLNEYSLTAKFWRELLSLYRTTAEHIQNVSRMIANYGTKRLKALRSGSRMMLHNIKEMRFPKKPCTTSDQKSGDNYQDRLKIPIPEF